MRTIFVISGAGISAESGIPTFRGANGLYADGLTEEALSAAAFQSNPERIAEFCDQLRAATAAASPNAAHVAFAQAAARGHRVRHFTQNVDDLLERAGAQEVVHLHGLITRARCVARAHPIDLPAGQVMPRRCTHTRCGSPMRPDVVFYDEPAPEYAILHRELRRASLNDALIIVGTSGSILPINEMVRAFSGWTGLANLEPEDAIDASLFDAVAWGPATTSVEGLLVRLQSELAG
jgi:NAD-dependent deacetylase